MSGNSPDLRERVRVGIAGWQYAPWRGTFYPTGLVQRRELEYASRALSSIEINSTFYRLQTAKTFASWHAQTPDDFVFSLKAPKHITHEKRLHDVEEPVAKFLASGVFELKRKLGPILWQFPPSFKFDPGSFEAFLQLLPHDADAVRALTRKHGIVMNQHISGDSLLELRHAVEIRHDSFVDAAFIGMLRRHRVAMVVADSGRRWPEFEDACTDFMYVRLHGAGDIYASGYSDNMLQCWADRIRLWATGAPPKNARLISNEAAPECVRRDVFCYFDNTMKEDAPLNAMRVLDKLDIAPRGGFRPESRDVSDRPGRRTARGRKP